MGAAHSSSLCLSSPTTTKITHCCPFHHIPKPSSNSSSIPIIQFHLQKPTSNFISQHHYSPCSPCASSKIVPLRCARVGLMETQEGSGSKPVIDIQGIDEELVEKIIYDALLWSSLHGLVVGDKSVQVCA